MSVYTNNNMFKTLNQKIFQGEKQIKKIYAGKELIYPDKIEIEERKTHYTRLRLTRTKNFRWPIFLNDSHQISRTGDAKAAGITLNNPEPRANTSVAYHFYSFLNAGPTRTPENDAVCLNYGYDGFGFINYHMGNYIRTSQDLATVDIVKGTIVASYDILIYSNDIKIDKEPLYKNDVTTILSPFIIPYAPAHKQSIRNPVSYRLSDFYETERAYSRYAANGFFMDVNGEVITVKGDTSAPFEIAAEIKVTIDKEVYDLNGLPNPIFANHSSLDMWRISTFEIISIPNNKSIYTAICKYNDNDLKSFETVSDKELDYRKKFLDYVEQKIQNPVDRIQIPTNAKNSTFYNYIELLEKNAIEHAVRYDENGNAVRSISAPDFSLTASCSIYNSWRYLDKNIDINDPLTYLTFHHLFKQKSNFKVTSIDGGGLISFFEGIRHLYTAPDYNASKSPLIYPFTAYDTEFSLAVANEPHYGLYDALYQRDPQASSTSSARINTFLQYESGWGGTPQYKYDCSGIYDSKFIGFNGNETFKIGPENHRIAATVQREYEGSYETFDIDIFEPYGTMIFSSNESCFIEDSDFYPFDGDELTVPTTAYLEYTGYDEEKNQWITSFDSEFIETGEKFRFIPGLPYSKYRWTYNANNELRYMGPVCDVTIDFAYTIYTLDGCQNIYTAECVDLTNKPFKD